MEAKTIAVGYFALGAVIMYLLLGANRKKIITQEVPSNVEHPAFREKQAVGNRF